MPNWPALEFSSDSTVFFFFSKLVSNSISSCLCLLWNIGTYSHAYIPLTFEGRVFLQKYVAHSCSFPGSLPSHSWWGSPIVPQACRRYLPFLKGLDSSATYGLRRMQRSPGLASPQIGRQQWICFLMWQWDREPHPHSLWLTGYHWSPKFLPRPVGGKNMT